MCISVNGRKLNQHAAAAALRVVGAIQLQIGIPCMCQ